MKFDKVFIIILVIMVLLNCTKKEEYKRIKLYSSSKQSEHTEEEGSKGVTIAIAPVISPKRSLILYEDLVKYLEKKSNIPIKIIQKNTYEEINNILKIGYADLGFVCTSSFILCERDFKAEIFVIPQVKGALTYNSYIIVNVNSTFKKFEDLKGKSFAFCDPLSLSGFFYPISKLKLMNKNYLSFFYSTIFTNSHDNSIRAVADGIVDGAAVDSIVYNYLVDSKDTYVKKTKVIEISPSFGIPPIINRSGLNRKIKKELQNIFINMHSDPEGYEILRKIYIDKFVLPRYDIYTSAKELMRNLE